MNKGKLVDVKTAVVKAKEYVIELFGDGPITNVALEEVERDEMQGIWRITIGFNRPATSNSIAAVGALMRGENGIRVYRIVTLDNDGRMLSVKRRDIAGE